jgi:hypothetical protein
MRYPLEPRLRKQLVPLAARVVSERLEGREDLPQAVAQRCLLEHVGEDGLTDDG